jgi:prepilin-type N-terminal cleavage/methylation domain-containing protein
MTRVPSDERGFTLAELLVSIFLVAIVTTTLLQVALSGTRGSETARSVTEVAQEARLGLNRMVRDTREAMLIDDASATGYTVKIDFDSSGTYQNPNPAGDFEILTFAWDNSDKEITLNGELLVDGVHQITGKDVFSYSSNFLSYDWNADGVTTPAELDDAPLHGITGVGNNNDTLDYPELNFISGVAYAFRVQQEGYSERFYSGAQLRNRR